MNRETKEKTWEEFRDNPDYTKATYFVFRLIDINILQILTTIKLYDVLIKKIDDGSINHSMNNKQTVTIKQQIILDANSKIMSVIETLLVLLYAINEGYNKVPELMTFYEMTMIDSSISNIKSKQFNLRKLIGLCDLEKLDLEEEEKKLLGIRYKTTCDIFQEVLEKFVTFYEKYKIIHGKNKHGFSYISGLSKDSENLSIEDSMVVVFDRRKKENMPPGTIENTNRDFGADTPWFTVESVLKINKKLFSEMSSNLSDLQFFFKYVTNNHLSYAENCGEGYLPFQYENGDEKIRPGIFLGDEFNDEDKKIFENMVIKVSKDMHAPKRRLEFNFKSVNPEVNKSMEDDIVTNIWSELEDNK